MRFNKYISLYLICIKHKELKSQEFLIFMNTMKFKEIKEFYILNEKA